MYFKILLLMAATVAKHGVAALNVLGSPLNLCCSSPMTGYFRDGFCSTTGSNSGRHTVCGIITKDFLNFTAARGNDLATPRPPSFPGLQPGDKWCLCAGRWKEVLDAYKSGAAPAGAVPRVVLSATNADALQVCSLDDLRAHAAAEEEEVPASPK